MSQVEAVLKALEKSYCGLTFAEITKKVNDTKDAVRKTMFYLHKEGRVVRAQDRDGIVHYNITKQGQEWLAKKAPKVEEAPKVEDMAIAKASDLAQKLSAPKPAWEILVQEAEQRGFAKGYAEGAKASQRQAFADGKEAVINRLRQLLS